MPFLFDLRTKPITKLQSVNESHHQTLICAITETHHQTSIQPLKPTTKLQSNHQPLPIQPPNNHVTHHRLTQTLNCAITKTPPQTPITTNPHPPPRWSINLDLHHADPHKPMPSTLPRQVSNTICTKTHKNKKCQRERPLDLREELEAYGFGFGFEQNQEIKRVQEG